MRRLPIPGRPLAAASLFALLSFATATTAQDPPAAQPQTPKAAPTPRWYDRDLPGAMRLARERGQLVLLYCWLDGSPFCGQLWSESLGAAANAARVARFVCFQAEATTPEGGGILRDYGVTTLPTTLAIAPNGGIEDAIVGYVTPTAFTAEVDRILAGRGTVSALRADATESPENLDKRFELAMKLAWVGDRTQSDVLLDTIRTDDPDGHTVGGARLALLDATQSAQAEADPNDSSTWDPSPVRTLLGRLRIERVRFQGWDWVARVETSRGEHALARSAWREAWPHLPKTREAEWPLQVANGFWVRRDELGADERTFLATNLDRLFGNLPNAPDPQDDIGRERTAGQLAALARGRWLAGRRDEARALVDRAIDCNDSPELRALRQEMN